MIGSQGVAFAVQDELLCRRQRKLLVDRLIEVADELVELFHAEQRGYEFGTLRRRSGGDAGESIDAVLLDEAKAEGVGVGDDGHFPVLVVRSSQGRRLKAPSMDIGQIGASVDAFAIGFFDRPEQPVLQAFAEASLAAAIGAIEENHSLLKVKRLRGPKPAEGADSHAAQASPGPSAFRRYGLDVGKRVWCLSQAPAGLVGEVDGPLAVLARSPLQCLEVGKGNIRQTLHIGRRLGSRRVKPSHESLKVAL